MSHDYDDEYGRPQSFNDKPREKSYWAQKAGRVKAALNAYLDGKPEKGPVTHSVIDLEDCLLDEGLLVLPRATGHGKYRVLADGKPVPLVGRDVGESGPMDAEEAAEAFLLAAAKDDGAAIMVRPATNDELVISAVTGDPVVKPEPVKIAVHNFRIEVDDNLGALALRAWDVNGNAVLLAMDDATRMELSEALDGAL
ncbi:hypothetical protein [Acrocarpospora sp. B8E8]|uniref:hypothetical protein n=1 Tax=Acrocarpospora sp. B8E8 TaxID=3153572 RepID=UPI00325C66E7